MKKKSLLRFKSRKAAFALLAVIALLAVPIIASASNANRVFYMPDQTTFNPASAWGGDIAEGGGKGINKLTLLAGPGEQDITFVVRNNNESGRTGTTFFETRKGPGNVDLSPFVQLSATPDFSGAKNTVTIPFNGKADSPLYVKVHISSCTAGGTFRIQAHPGGTTNQGNGPGVVVYVNCTSPSVPVPATPTPTPTPEPTATPEQQCYDYNGNPTSC